MTDNVEIVEVEPGDARLDAVFPVIQELRTHLDRGQFDRLYEAAHPQGYRVAALFEGDKCRAVAGYRLYTNLFRGKQLYIDDLVTSEQSRSNGYGRALNTYLRDRARSSDCDSLQLDSALHRADAHRFYFRERYKIRSFHFESVLDD